MIESFRFVNHGNGSILDFNDDEVPFNELVIERVRRLDKRERSRQHGLWPSYQYYGEMILRATGDILMQDSAGYNQKRLDMQKVLVPAPHLGEHHIGRLEIQFTGLEEMYAECTLDGDPELPMEGLGPSRGAYMIPWLSFDPAFYSTTEYTATLGTPSLTGGRTYPKTYPETYSVLVGSNDVLVENLGSFRTFPRIEIYGPVTDPTLSLVHLGHSFDWTLHGLTIPDGDFAMVDFKERTVVSDESGSDWYDFAEGTWWAIEPGENTITFSAFSAASPSEAMVMWENAYIF